MTLNLAARKRKQTMRKLVHSETNSNCVCEGERERKRERERENMRQRENERTYESKRPAQIDSARNSISRQLITPVHLCKVTHRMDSLPLRQTKTLTCLKVYQESIAWT